MNVFTREEALALLTHRTGRDDPAGSQELAEELGFLPLALAQAAAVIAAQHLDYPTYLARLRAVPVQDILKRTTGEPYPHSVAEAIVLAIDAAADEDQTGLCRRLINIVALLSTAGVSRELLYAAGQESLLQSSASGTAAEPQAIDEAIGQLANASLLTFSRDDATVTAHRLTMRVAVERQAQDGTLAALGADIMAFLRTVTESLPEPEQNRLAARDVIQQIVALHEHLAPYLGEQDAAVTRNLLQLRGWAVGRLRDLGDSFAQVIEYSPDLITDLERVLGPDDPSTLTSRSNLAHAYLAVGRLDEAISLFERTLIDFERVLDRNHPSISTCRANLAGAYQAAGRLDEAISLFERTLTDLERVLGPNHAFTLTCRNNLATTYRIAQQLDKPITLLQRTLAGFERILGLDHPSTLAARSNLASAYQDAGLPEEAIPVFERTLADSERILGLDHPSTLAARSNLANAYQVAGRLDEAVPLFERSLADRERVLGPDHPSTLMTRANFANAYQSAGLPEKAIPLSEQTLTDRERVLGPDHLYTLISRNNLAGAYHSAGRLDEAISLFERSHADFERILGPHHPYTLTSRANLARAYEDSGRTRRTT